MNVDITYEFEILREIIVPELDPVSRAVDLSGPAVSALVPKPWRNICGSSREAIAAALRAAELRLWRSCFRAPTAEDLASITQADPRVTLVAASSPWVAVLQDLGVERATRWTRPIGPLSFTLALGFGIDPKDPYTCRVVEYYSRTLDHTRTPVIA